MPKSPPFEIPPGMEGKSLAGVRACGCITAAMAVTEPPYGYHATVKEVRDFYADMASTGREVRWMDDDEIRSKFGPCNCSAKLTPTTERAA